MAKIPTWMPVVALALRDAERRILLQQRPAHKHHGGLWELPGGKVESEESPRLALVREIAEELSVTIDHRALVPALVADEGPDGGTVLIVYECLGWHGEIVATEGQDWGWFSLEEARRLPTAPMDGDLLARLSD